MAENTVSTKEIQKSIEGKYDPIRKLEWNGLHLNIKKTLSFEEMMTFVNDVVTSCFTTETNEYMPEVKDFVTRCCIVEQYAGIELPEDIDGKYSFVYGNDLTSCIVKAIDPTQFNAMINAIERKLEHRAQSNIEAINKQMNEVVSQFASLEQNLSGIFNGVDNKTIEKIANAIAGGSFDETKLVKAFAQNADSKG